MANMPEAMRQAELAKIPLWTGSKVVDQFSAEQWIERIQKAKDASTWNDDQTMSFVFNALGARPCSGMTRSPAVASTAMCGLTSKQPSYTPTHLFARPAQRLLI